MHDPFVTEVFDLHRFLEAWLTGHVAEDIGLRRLERALVEEFRIVHPDGSRLGKAEVIERFAKARAGKPASYSLLISDLEARSLGGRHCLITYRETHVGETGRDRISTALLSQQNELVRWLFLQETLIRAPA